MEDSATVQCPWCWETISLYIDPESQGELVEDCEVCCRPWVLYISRGHDGEAAIQIAAGNQ